MSRIGEMKDLKLYKGHKNLVGQFLCGYQGKVTLHSVSIAN